MHRSALRQLAPGIAIALLIASPLIASPLTPARSPLEQAPEPPPAITRSPQPLAGDGGRSPAPSPPHAVPTEGVRQRVDFATFEPARPQARAALPFTLLRPRS